jgi:predicted Zn-dependent protease
MTKKKQSNKRNLFLLVILLVITIYIFTLLVNIQTHITSTSNIPSPYTSTLLNISFTIPEEFTLEKFPDKIVLKANNNSGEIKITKETTKYNSLNSYISGGDKTEIDDRQMKRDFLSINGLDAIMIYTHYPKNAKLDNKSFIFYKDNTLYIISTTSKELYRILDQISLSFHPAL